MLSEFDSIKILVKNKPKKLDFKIKKKKGIIDNKTMMSKEIDKETYEAYLKAKNLKKTEDFPNPYWNIYYLIAPFNMFSDKIQYNISSSWADAINKKYDEKYKKYKLTSYYSITGILNYFSHEFHKEFIKKNKKLNSLFIFNTLHMSSIEEYLVYRENNSIYSYLDNCYALELPFYVSSEKEKSNIENREKFLKVFSKVSYTINEKNICDRKNNTLNFDKKLNYICVDVSYFLWSSKRYYSYINSQFYLNIITYSFENLDKEGILKLSIGELNNQLLFDIIGILNFYFDKVYIYKAAPSAVITQYKKLICQGFKGITKKELEELYKLCDIWNGLSLECNTDINSFQLESDKYYLNSILNYKDNYKDIIEFNDIESIKKIKCWNKIANIYNEIKLCKKEAVVERELKTQTLNTIKYLKIQGIPINIKYNKLIRENLEDYMLLDFSQININNFLKPLNLTIKTSYETGKYSVPKIDDLENSLKFTKRILDTFEYEDYKKVKNKIKRLEPLKAVISKKIGYTVTQAFLKFYEILEQYDLIDDIDVFNSFHFCELPGQFIKATMRYIEKKKKTIKKHNWKAQSLNPYYYKDKTIFKDEYGLVKNYPDNWDFGEDNTGDITKDDNIRYYSDIISESHLITSDCGLDMSDPTKSVYQDKELSYINFCQILMVLNSIKKNSHYVAKIYLPQTTNYIISLNYILSESFQKVYFHKSAINAGSSEVYIVCKNFKSVDRKIVNYLFEIKNILLFDKIYIKIPQNFLDNYQKIISVFIQRHINHIQRNIYNYENKFTIEDTEYIDKIIEKNIKNWIKFYKFK